MHGSSWNGHDREMPMTRLTEFSDRIEGLRVIQTKQFDDDRGTIREIYRESAFRDFGAGSIQATRQVNLTQSRRGAIRGLHGEDMVKLIGLAAGRGFGAFFDTRPRSGSFGSLFTIELEPGTQLVVPSGVCNGFQALTDDCLYLYCFDTEWAHVMPGVAVNALDPDLAIPWPVTIDPADRSLLSEKDAFLPNFGDLEPVEEPAG
jgi:dTDP-4-dehydrorhamnose 3,5-epimerase